MIVIVPDPGNHKPDPYTVRPSAKVGAAVEDPRAWRQRLGLYQKEAGLLLARSDETISSYERGRRQIPARLARIMVVLVTRPDLARELLSEVRRVA